MEKKLLNWYQYYHVQRRNSVNSKLLQQMAILYSTNNDFRASKGWLEKFKRRHKIQ